MYLYLWSKSKGRICDYHFAGLPDFPQFYEHGSSLWEYDEPGCFVVEEVDKDDDALDNLKPQSFYTYSLHWVLVVPKLNIVFEGQDLKYSVQTTHNSSNGE